MGVDEAAIGQVLRENSGRSVAALIRVVVARPARPGAGAGPGHAARASGRAVEGRVARTGGPHVAGDARAALRGGRGRAAADVPRALAHASRGAAAEVLHRHGRGRSPARSATRPSTPSIACSRGTAASTPADTGGSRAPRSPRFSATDSARVPAQPLALRAGCASAHPTSRVHSGDDWPPSFRR